MPNYSNTLVTKRKMYKSMIRYHFIQRYALAIHGSLSRDFDLIAVAWVEFPSQPQIVVDEIINTFSIKQQGNPTLKLHNRLVYTLNVSFGDCFLDFSFIGI